MREWLGNQAAGGYVEYDPASGTYTLPPEHALALADETSSVFLPGSFQMIAAMFADEPRISENFRTGGGTDWGQHDRRLFEGTERSLRPNYVGNLLTRWIPALEGVADRLRQGRGSPTSAAAMAHPRSSWRRHSRTPGLPASTITSRPSPSPDAVLMKPALQSA